MISSVRQTEKVLADKIRLRVLEQVLANNGGYLSQACSSAEILATLLSSTLRLSEVTRPYLPPPFSGVPCRENIASFTGDYVYGDKAPDLDRFYLSAVHYALVLYATLVEVGRLGPTGLTQFNQDGSSVEMIGAEHSPGHSLTCGSLGQGLSQAGGIALARKMKGESGRTVVFMSDGEFQSGQTWETLQALSHHQIGNLIAIVDCNGQQCDGPIDTVMTIEPLADKIRLFGWRVEEIDGHDPFAIASACSTVDRYRPSLILAHTNPCQGIEILEGRRPKLHYLRFSDEADRLRFCLYRATIARRTMETGR